MSYIVYISYADPVKKIEPLGIYSDISKAREVLHSDYSQKYLNNEHEVKVVGEDDVVIMKIDRGWISNSGIPICYYRIVKCGSTGLSSEVKYSPTPPTNTTNSNPTEVFIRPVIDLSEILSVRDTLKKVE